MNKEIDMSGNVLEEANQLIYGDRNEAYGHPKKNIGQIAELWSSYLNKTIDSDDVCMMMILVKIARQSHRVKRDNLVDIAGYAGVADRLNEPHASDQNK